MTAPAGDIEDPAAAAPTGARPSAAAAGTTPRLRRGQLVTFAATDVILGGSYYGAGVVVATGDGDGDPVTIRPLAPQSVQVLPDWVQPASADDVAP